MKKLLALCLILAAAPLHAAPTVSSVTGAAVYGSTLTFFGSGFGTKPIRSQQTLYANFKGNVNPSTWSYVSSWSDVANFEYKTTNCEEGAGCGGEVTGWESANKITAALIHDDVGAGGKFSISWEWKSDIGNVSDTMNWKTWRWWPFGGASKNNIYGGQQIDGGFVNLVEKLLDGAVAYVNGVDRFYTADIEPVSTGFQQVEMLFQLNSSPNTADGKFVLVQNGSEEINSTTWRSNTTNDTSANGRYRMFYPVHMLLTGAGTPISAGHYFRIDNIMADTSWCAVWVTVNATNAAGGTKYFLPVTSWAGGTVQAVWANDKFPNGTRVYGYIRANDGTVNSAGFPITVSGSVVATNPAPTLTSLSVVSGPSSGLTATTLAGTGFLAGAGVDFGGSAATSVVVNSATSITLNTPAHAAGSVTATVSNTDGQTGAKSNAFTFVAPPTLTSVSANSGPVAGGQTVTLTGTLFSTSITGVTFGGSSATSVTRLSATSISCVTPAHSAGAVSVVVTNNDGQTGTLAGGYTYNTAPSVTSVSPASGPAAGSTSVTITGTGFTATASSITFGGSLLTGVVRTNSTTITGNTPSHAAGAVAVIVSNADTQTGTLSNGYTYVAAPTVTSLNVVSGSTTGATAVTLTGTGFSSSVSGVTFGGTSATSVSRVSATSITCLTPAHVAATVSVIVTNSDSQTGTIGSAYTFVDSVVTPVLSSLSVSTGPASGGVSNTLTGSNFLNGASVAFGTAPASGVIVDSPTRIRCTVPPYMAGLVAVKVTNPDAQVATLSNAFTYVLSPPFISALTVSTGTCSPGATTYLLGTGFQSGATVFFGTSSATNVAVYSSSIACTVPGRVAGSVSVLVTNTDGQSYTKSTAYTYVAAPVVTTVTPSTGERGGATTAVSGSFFLSGAGVYIGTTTAVSVTFVNSTSLSVVVPSLPEGTYAIKVTNPDGQNFTLSSAYTTTTPQPSIIPTHRIRGRVLRSHRRH